MIQLGFPWGLVAVLSIPALVAIYFLIGRSRRQVVSALFLWENQKPSPRGGKRFERLSTPLLFFLELLALLLLALAAILPQLRSSSARVPLVVVLDNSFSMKAGSQDSARARAEAALGDAVRSGDFAPIHLVLAGRETRLAAESVTDTAMLTDRLASWNNTDSEADLGQGIALARELGGAEARIWVLTDRAPEAAPASGTLKWQAFGQKRGNRAIVNASRGFDDDGAWCQLEIANLDQQPAAVTLQLKEAGPLATRSLQLGAGETRRLVLALPAGNSLVRLELEEEDALDIDNRVSLLAPSRRPVAVKTDFVDPELADLVAGALAISDRVTATTATPDLIITDRPGTVDSEAWRFTIDSSGETRPLAGPFVLNRRHPLCDGLSLGGTVWGASRRPFSQDLPVITAGDDGLLTEQRQGDTVLLTLFFDPKLSTFQRTPAWPILFWNLIEWRGGQKPGLENPNLRIGTTSLLKLADAGELQIEAPDGSSRTLTPTGRSVLLSGEAVGLYKVHSANPERFAVNALDVDESDLSQSQSGVWGEWVTSERDRAMFRPLAPLLLFSALLVLSSHWWFVRREAGGASP